MKKTILVLIIAMFTLAGKAYAEMSYGISGAITQIDAALSGVSEVRGKLGGISNRLNSTIANMDQVKVNLQASQGRIADADFAVETGNLAKNQILQQAATAMIAQANASKNSVLNLLRG